MGRFKFKRLQKWQTGGTSSDMELSVPLPMSESGLIMRWCPNDECTPRRFQLGETQDIASDRSDDIVRREPGSEGCTCPYCGTDASDEDFFAPEDLDATLKKIEWAVAEDAAEILQGLADDFNRGINKGGGNILGIEMTVPHRRKPEPKPWREDLLRSMRCDICGRNYGVYAIGFFCPDCGGVNLSNHFHREVALIVAQLDLAEEIESEKQRELSYRLLGNAHEDVVTAFETYLKSAFKFVYDKRLSDPERKGLKKKLGGNPFQSLRRSKELFDHLGMDLFSPLTESEIEELRINIEKRHVVGHNLGIADERYAEVATDAETGETVSLLAGEIDRFAEMCFKVVTHVEGSIPEFKPA